MQTDNQRVNALLTRSKPGSQDTKSNKEIGQEAIPGRDRIYHKRTQTMSHNIQTTSSCKCFFSPSNLNLRKKRRWETPTAFPHPDPERYGSLAGKEIELSAWSEVPRSCYRLQSEQGVPATLSLSLKLLNYWRRKASLLAAYLCLVVEGLQINQQQINRRKHKDNLRMQVEVVSDEKLTQQSGINRFMWQI